MHLSTFPRSSLAVWIYEEIEQITELSTIPKNLTVWNLTSAWVSGPLRFVLIDYLLLVLTFEGAKVHCPKVGTSVIDAFYLSTVLFFVGV
ncbi:hypothetical protein Y032_0228g2867 [Ancylostoma ceylanicum]|uniref:Uncharacterized protein n=1 Tax=Ancylostoma ceylanicum TaxID=53326 RepID=A0A016SGJ3_9BILA|nr:hypothetical protein Y032_0228g2867 [Ancylostoma ceylanicum]